MADGIAAKAGSACIGGRAPVGVVLRHMRGRPALAEIRNKAFGVVKLVGTDRNPVCAPAFGHHSNGGIGNHLTTTLRQFFELVLRRTLLTN